MSATINSIKPINWFNYKGADEDNEVEFSAGTNVIVGKNNGGKTKLYNAFRYILTDKITFKKTGPDGIPFFEPVKIDDENIHEIFNYRTLEEMKVNHTRPMGVELRFTHKDKQYVVEKIITVLKVSENNCKIQNKEYKVYTYKDGQGKRPYKVDLKDILEKLVRRMYLPFFLLEGEQMGSMIPLKGAGLKETIKSLTPAATEIDNIVSKTDELQEKIDKAIKANEKKIAGLDDKKNKLVKEKHDIDSQLEVLQETMNKNAEDYKRYKESYDLLKAKASEAEDKKKLLEELQGLIGGKKNATIKIDESHQNFLDSLTDTTSFNISKLFDETSVNESFNKLDERLNDVIAKRRLELDEKINKEDERLIEKFESKQPHPNILRQMLVHECEDGSVGQCFVCKSKLSPEGKEFIEKVLIPHFEKSGDTRNEKGDVQMQTTQVLKDSFNEILNEARASFMAEDGFIKQYEEEQLECIENVENFRSEIEDFQKKHGDESDIEGAIKASDYEDFQKYDDGKTTAKINLEVAKKEYIALKKKSDELQKKINEDINDDTATKYQELKGFIDDLDSVFETSKEKIYNEFAQDLEKKSNDRFHKLFRNNKEFANQKLRVAVDQTELGKRKHFDFDAFCEDKQGRRLTQEGGAATALMPLSLAFGLIDFLPKAQNPPFIADAPVSQVTVDTKKSFFQTIIGDQTFNQSILICMDLWDSEKEDLTDDGIKICKEVKQQENGRFMCLIPKPEKSGVTFKIK